MKGLASKLCWVLGALAKEVVVIIGSEEQGWLQWFLATRTNKNSGTWILRQLPSGNHIMDYIYIMKEPSTSDYAGFCLRNITAGAEG